MKQWQKHETNLFRSNTEQLQHISKSGDTRDSSTSNEGPIWARPQNMLHVLGNYSNGWALNSKLLTDWSTSRWTGFDVIKKPWLTAFGWRQPKFYPDFAVVRGCSKTQASLPRSNPYYFFHSKMTNLECLKNFNANALLYPPTSLHQYKNWILCLNIYKCCSIYIATQFIRVKSHSNRFTFVEMTPDKFGYRINLHRRQKHKKFQMNYSPSGFSIW